MQLFTVQCTMGKQLIHSFLAYTALWASRWTQQFSIQYTMGKHVIHSYLYRTVHYPVIHIGIAQWEDQFKADTHSHFIYYYGKY